jgi:23S rRNA (cytosine1962-C5)-methyltransferase
VLKNLKLKSGSSLKVIRGEREFSAKDVEEIPKGITPGEYVFLTDESIKKKHLAYINPHSDAYTNIRVLKTFPIELKVLDSEILIKKTIESLIHTAIEKRLIFKDYVDGCRLIYGGSDSLPGLIVDMYVSHILIQINTAGLDKYREEIKSIFSSKFPEKRTILFDNVEYRKHEVLPVYENESINEDLNVIENGLHYLIKKDSLQKIGYYYDHRENRQKLFNMLSKVSVKLDKGLDLFSYVGSWGLHLLKAGVKEVDFVDQANMENNIATNLKLNNFEGRGTFYRRDVFKYLDELISQNKEYDIIVSDPPAFTKSEKNKHTALLGYEKLHLKSLRLVKNGGFFVAASCTHYVDLNELDKTAQEAAMKIGVELQLIDLGLQGIDHPMRGFKDKSFYIKYLLYSVRRGNNE